MCRYCFDGEEEGAPVSSLEVTVGNEAPTLVWLEPADAFVSNEGEALDFNRVPEQTDFAVESIAAEAGDMVVWNSYLPHGNGDNHEASCRLTAYCTMFPAEHEGGAAVPLNGCKRTNHAATV